MERFPGYAVVKSDKGEESVNIRHLAPHPGPPPREEEREPQVDPTPPLHPGQPPREEEREPQVVDPTPLQPPVEERAPGYVTRSVKTIKSLDRLCLLLSEGE